MNYKEGTHGCKYESREAPYEEHTEHHADHQSNGTVASSKLRKAKERADASRPYFHTLENTLEQIAAGNTDLSSVYTKKSKNEKWCYVVIAGDRGLAGGYNSNLFKEMESQTAGKTTVYFLSERKQWNITNAGA